MKMKKRIIGRLTCISIVVLFVMSAALAATIEVTVTKWTNDGATVLDETYAVLFEGTVVLSPGETFNVTAYNSGTPYTVNRTTPLGALDKAATTAGFTYDVTDKNYGTSGSLLLDNVGTYLYNSPVKWYAYVNDVFKDGYNNHDAGLNVIELADGDTVEFYYAADVVDKTDLTEVQDKATAAVKTVASTGVTPTDWTLVLDGAKTEMVTKTYFEQGLACAGSGHQVFGTDGDGNEWGGVPLWLLVAMVDDDPDEVPDHFNFNDDLADQHYEVKVIASDGWSAVFDSADIARSSNYIVANTLNGSALPYGGDKPSWPLHLKGPAVLGGQQVGGIVRIELNNLPQPPEGWTLAMLGEVGDTITQQEFEDGLACTQSGHLVEWTDTSNNVWSGVPLWVLLGAVDDIELANHWTFNDAVAADTNYTVNVIAGDGYSRTFSGWDLARNDGYIVANRKNGTELTEADGYPLKLNGEAITSGKDRIGNIVRIEILELQTPPPAEGSYNLALKGKITDVLSQAEIEEGLACADSGHLVNWTQEIKDESGNVTETHEWSGIPLWFLCGWVDDRQPHEFNAVQATAGYKITVKASDGYAKDFTAADVAWSNDYIVATMKDGEPLPEGKWPLQLVGDPLTRADGTLGGMSVAQIAEIALTEFGVPAEIPVLHIVKYAEDRTTIVNETWLDYTDMMDLFDVIGDGVTLYKYQGVTMDPEDIWGQYDETKGGFKISNAVKGSRLLDLVSLVGGMGNGTNLVLVASDGYQTTLPYTSVYTTTEIQARQGDTILAWYADGTYVPGYADGMRLFFMPEDTIYGQWDMHETLPPEYWHYFYQTYSASDPEYEQYAPGILYPSCAGLSAKYVTEIRVYTVPEKKWYIDLDGRPIGGIFANVSKTYFEQALACQFGANHKVSYTDSQERAWEGMPLWFLCGFVDDADMHSDEAFNDTLALAGYNVILEARDGYTVTIPSKDIVRISNYIVANSLNDALIPEDDSSWPLRLVGTNVSGGLQVKGIAKIRLEFTPKYNLTTSSTMGGRVTTPGEDTFTYDEGKVVDLVATPDTGYRFVNWTGDVEEIADVYDATTTITMNDDYTVTANFEVRRVSSGGGGRVSDRDADGYSDFREEFILYSDPDDPCDPDPNSAACKAITTPTPKPAATPKTTATPMPTPVATPTATPTPVPATPTPEPPGFEALFAIAGLLAIALLALNRRK